jgi:hypothetical protein
MSISEKQHQANLRNGRRAAHPQLPSLNPATWGPVVQAAQAV